MFEQFANLDLPEGIENSETLQSETLRSESSDDPNSEYHSVEPSSDDDDSSIPEIQIRPGWVCTRTKKKRLNGSKVIMHRTSATAMGYGRQIHRGWVIDLSGGVRNEYLAGTQGNPGWVFT